MRWKRGCQVPLFKTEDIGMTYQVLSVGYTNHLAHNPDDSQWLRPSDPFDVRGSTIPSSPRVILLSRSAYKCEPLEHLGCHRSPLRRYACLQKGLIQLRGGTRWAVTVDAEQSTSKSSDVSHMGINRKLTSRYICFGVICLLVK